MKSNICDGKELEGEPEETYENTIMLEEKGDGIIQHLAHPRHHLRLENNAHDKSRHCQACKLPSYYDGNVYRCLQCDEFILHKSCAYIPRIKKFMLHPHPLTIDFKYTSGWFRCGKCYRYSCGYAYECRQCDLIGKFDIFCASINEPFVYHSHPHPLFVTTGPYESKTCSICLSGMEQPLNCVTCDFVVCFRCAILPHKARYMHDEHLLIFSYKEHANDEEIYGCKI